MFGRQLGQGRRHYGLRIYGVTIMCDNFSLCKTVDLLLARRVMEKSSTFSDVIRLGRQVLSMLCLVSIVVVSFQFQRPALAGEMPFTQMQGTSQDTTVLASTCAACGVVPSSRTGGSHCAHDHGGSYTFSSAAETQAGWLAGAVILSSCHNRALIGMAQSVSGEPPKA